MTFLFDATVENEFIVLIVEVAGEALSVNTDNIIVVDSALHDPGDKTTVILISRTTFINRDGTLAFKAFDRFVALYLKANAKCKEPTNKHLNTNILISLQ